MKKSSPLLCLLCGLATALAVAPPLAAEDAPRPAPASTTDVTLAGVAGIEDGDDGRRDDHEGYRNGVLFGVEHRSRGLEIGLRFEPTTAGWLDVTYRPESPFRLELTLDRTRRYSDTSIRTETTPLGTPVSTLYPYTNTLVPAFGDRDPVATRTRFKVRAAWLPSAGVVDFTVRGVDLRGERVPEAQGFAFGDSGAPAFFSPALADLDTQMLEGALGARLRLLCIDWNARVALGTRTSDTTTQTPIWGSASLLEMYQGAEGHGDPEGVEREGVALYGVGPLDHERPPDEEHGCLAEGAVLQADRASGVEDGEREARQRDPEDVGRAMPGQGGADENGQGEEHQALDEQRARAHQPPHQGVGAVVDGGRVALVDAVAGVEVVVHDVARGVDEHRAEGRQQDPAPGDRPVGRGDRRPQADGQEGHGERPGPGGEEVTASRGHGRANRVGRSGDPALNPTMKLR